MLYLGPGFLGSRKAFSMLALFAAAWAKELRPSGMEGAWAPGSPGEKLSGGIRTLPIGCYTNKK